MNRWVVALVIAAQGLGCAKASHDKKLRLATTTSVRDSGLLDVLVPAFEKKSGFHVAVVAVGSGKAIELEERGEADVAITHAPDEEKRELAAKKIGARTPFMHNEFVIVGPKDEIAVVAGASDANQALAKIAASGKKFVGRRDGSGTEQRELALWAAAGVDPKSAFIETVDAGMAEALKKASHDGAFALTDRSTLLAHKGELDLVVVFQGGDDLRNVYSILEPLPAQTGVDRDGAHALEEFLRSADGRTIIGTYGVEKLGEPLFSPER